MQWIKLVVWVLGATVALCMTAIPAHATEEEARVLILNGIDPYLPAYLAVDAAMRASLADETARRIVLFSETLDAQRFSVEALEPEYVALLTKKYAALRFDVVVVITPAALAFFRRHGERLWPGARVVYQGFQEAEIDREALPPNAIGVVTNPDAAGTVEIALRLQPNARHIVVVSGVADADVRYERLTRHALSTRAPLPPVRYLSGLPLPELAAQLAAEPADTIVLYLTQFRDRNGQPYTPREVLRAISKESVAPVYGFFESYVGFGAAAGSVESYETRGRLVAEQVRSALAGGPSDPNRILLETPNRCVADARALQHWSLDEGRLPNGCEVRFAHRPVWREYFWQIVATVALLAAQSALITALLVQGLRRRTAEHAAQVHASEAAHASRLAVAGELVASIAHEINQPLAAILSNVEAADLLVQSGEEQGELLRHILADIHRDDLRASEVIRRLRELLAKHEIEKNAVDINASVTEVAALLQGEAARRGVTIATRLVPTATIAGDRIQIQQVLINLLLNAMDAVADVGEDRRTIVVTLENAGRRITITLSDQGRGIAPDELPRLFDSFYSTKRAGMGLGLSIARTIVEAHGGRIWAEGTPGHGAVFHVEFPSVERQSEGPYPEAVV